MYFLNITRSWGGVAFLKKRKENISNNSQIKMLRILFFHKAFHFELKNLI